MPLDQTQNGLLRAAENLFKVQNDVCGPHREIGLNDKTHFELLQLENDMLVKNQLIFCFINN